jgi:hypothetical protein
MKNHWLDQINQKKKLKERLKRYEEQIINIIEATLKPKKDLKKHGGN